MRQRNGDERICRDYMCYGLELQNMSKWLTMPKASETGTRVDLLGGVE